jgi:hypothetical protein
MPWIIGIDEAGYGPNLGPLVMTSVTAWVPDRLVAADLWHVLRNAVRRHSDPPDRRLVIGDSKLVYSPAKGLEDLEMSVLAVLFAEHGEEQRVLDHFLEQFCPASVPDLRCEPWFTGQCRLPIHCEKPLLHKAAGRFRRTSTERRVEWGPVESVVVCPRRFNRLLDEWGSKGAILGNALTALLASNRSLGDGSEPVHVIIDKHGGRNTYAPMLQHALPDGMVVANEEGADRSTYMFLSSRAPVRFTFQPRADQEHFCVALASMISKYLREALMMEFNGFWQTHVPGLRPTAGYPGDSRRFYEAILPAAGGLNIPEEVLWRRR